jgi:glycosyltransferase involved in cell wall biosynthesis
MRSRITGAIELVRRRPWPNVNGHAQPHVGIVIVNYNTVRLIAGLLFTLYRVLPRGSFHRLVVVDNGSSDGSAQLLRSMDRAGMIELTQNWWPRTHGPGLNRGVNRLARRGDVDLIWVLDSDVLVLRPDALSAAVRHLKSTGAALIGQKKLGKSYAHVSSNLFDPFLVWQRGLPPFWDDGHPGSRMQIHLRRLGMKVEDFPFYRDGYLLHIGRGTLRQVREADEKSNPYYEWATRGPTEEPHYHGNPRGSTIFASMMRKLDQEVDNLTGSSLVAACQQIERLQVSESGVIETVRP